MTLCQLYKRLLGHLLVSCGTAMIATGGTLHGDTDVPKPGGPITDREAAEWCLTQARKAVADRPTRGDN